MLWRVFKDFQRVYVAHVSTVKNSPVGAKQSNLGGFSSN